MLGRVSDKSRTFRFQNEVFVKWNFECVVSRSSQNAIFIGQESDRQKGVREQQIRRNVSLGARVPLRID